jgi:2-C-methyl-D-erythritol 4-phosphate cytidylyltransferase
MSLRAAVVPVLPSWNHAEAVPLSSLCLHGEPLFVHAARALASLWGARVIVTTPSGSGGAVRSSLADAGLSGVRVVEGVASVGAALATALDDVANRSGPAAEHAIGVVLLHDPRCPLVPPSCLREVLERAVGEPDAVHVGARSVTDTVKIVNDGSVLATVDRDVLRVLTSPMAISVPVLRQLHSDGRLADCTDMIDVLELARAAGTRVRWVAAPSLARRIAETAEVTLLECLVEVRADTWG